MKKILLLIFILSSFCLISQKEKYQIGTNLVSATFGLGYIFQKNDESGQKKTNCGVLSSGIDFNALVGARIMISKYLGTFTEFGLTLKF